MLSYNYYNEYSACVSLYYMRLLSGVCFDVVFVMPIKLPFLIMFVGVSIGLISH